MDDVYVYLDQVFEWDRMKAARNAIKHRVRFPEAASVFFDEDALFEADPDHSVVLSARVATSSERRRYDDERRRG